MDLVWSVQISIYTHIVFGHAVRSGCRASCFRYILASFQSQLGQQDPDPVCLSISKWGLQFILVIVASIVWRSFSAQGGTVVASLLPKKSQSTPQVQILYLVYTRTKRWSQKSGRPCAGRSEDCCPNAGEWPRWPPLPHIPSTTPHLCIATYQRLFLCW